MHSFLFLRRTSAMLALACTLVGSTAIAQSAPGGNAAAQQHLEDFVHYSLTANVELAEANAQWLLQNMASDVDFAILMNDSGESPQRFARAMQWAQEVPELQDVTSALTLRIEAGRMALSRDQDRVAESISMLDGSRREQLLARGRLLAAGEYAVPSLVQEMTSGQNEERRWASAEMLHDIGRESVYPLSVALPNIGPEHQRKVCQILGSIGYNHAGPALLELSQDEDAPAFVREAAGRAYRQLGGNPELDDPGTLHTILGRQYFENAKHLVADPWGSVNNIWQWDDFAGLMTVQVPTELYGPIMSMRSSAIALEYDPANSTATSQFVAANLRRENLMPDGWEDPVFGDLAYTPQFYAMVHGSRTGQDVLALALESNDTPLLDAMQYPDRRVQYETALILARALPDDPFAGSYRVVPILAGAVRTGGEEYAIVVAETNEDQRAMANRLEADGFSVVGSAASIEELADPISRAPGVDFAVVQTTSMQVEKADLDGLRRNPRTSATPVMLVVQAGDLPTYKNEYRADPIVGVSRAGISDQAFNAAVEDLMQRGAGGRLTRVDSDIYAMESLAALREIALSRPGAYAIEDAESALVDSLQTRTGGTRLLVAEILSLIESERSQQAILDAALAEDVGGDRIPLLNHAASSIRRSGNLAHRRHVEELQYLIDNSSGDVADAAARVHGAMNLSPEDSMTIVIPKD